MGPAATTSGQAILESEVRELVHRRGIDPVAEPTVVARLVDEVISDYLDRHQVGQTAVGAMFPSV